MTFWSFKMVICICATRNMYKQLYVMIAMLKKTQPKLKKIYAFVEDNIDSNNIVTFINVSNYQPLVNNPVNKGNWATYMTMARCYFADLLPNEDKVIYLDLDVMIEQDISEFWELEMNEKEVAGVVDTKFYLTYKPDYIKDVSTYINAGVLLMNLKAIRDNETNKKMKELLFSLPMFYLDQDCINLTCNILLINCKYNSGYATKDSNEALIYHVIRCKPWDQRSEWYNKWQSIYQSIEEN